MVKRLSHEQADKQVDEAMQEPMALRVQRFRQLLAQRGGKAEQPFPTELPPRQPRQPDRDLPARTQV